MVAGTVKKRYPALTLTDTFSMQNAAFQGTGNLFE